MVPSFVSVSKVILEHVLLVSALRFAALGTTAVQRDSANQALLGCWNCRFSVVPYLEVALSILDKAH